MMAHQMKTNLFINNEYVPSASGQTLTIHDPYDGDLISDQIQIADPASIDAAVAAARDAFTSWCITPGQQRVARMLKYAALVEEHAQEIAQLESKCMGAPILITKMLVSTHAAVFRYYAGLIANIKGDVFPEEGDGVVKMIQYEPLGVCAGIAAWNAAPLFAAFKIAPAIAAGNTFILKCPEKSPLGTLFLGQLFVEAGFPPGVVNIVTGGPTTGRLLASHMNIAKIAFTGSTAVGREIQVAAAKSNLKQVSLELGGKSASIVFQDAQLENAIKHNSQTFLLNNAQVCSAASRVLVHESIAEAFSDGLKTAFSQLARAMGDPSSVNTFMGPLSGTEHKARVQNFIREAQESGIKCVQAGEETEEAKRSSCFVQPTICFDPPDDSPVYNQEVFGPVLCIKTFKSEDEALSMANKTSFGLSASIYTSDLQRGLRLVPRLEAGMVSINSAVFPFPQLPWGGWKESGYGREGGIDGLKEYLQSKTVQVNIAVPSTATANGDAAGA